MNKDIKTSDVFGSVANFKTTLTYGVYSSLLAKFIDVKTELYRQNFSSTTVLNLGPEDKGVVSKLLQELEKSFGISAKNLVDLTGTQETVPETVQDFLQDVSVCTDDISTSINYTGPSEATVAVFMEIPRTCRTTSLLKLFNGISFEVHNIFQPYHREGFTLAFNFSDQFRVSIRPEEKDGQKGTGEVYVYVYYKGTLYKDLLSKYVPSAGEILKFYRG